jgi:hypothetical protein
MPGRHQVVDAGLVPLEEVAAFAAAKIEDIEFVNVVTLTCGRCSVRNKCYCCCFLDLNCIVVLRVFEEKR